MLNYLLSFGIGSCFGSFFSVICERLPLGNSIITPASHCSNCQSSLKARDLIPVVSYLRLGGCCSHCHLPYSRTSFIAEIVTGTLFCLLTFTHLWTVRFIPGLLLMLTALLLSITDSLYWLVEPLIFFPLTLCTALAIWLLETPFSFHLVDSLFITAILVGVSRLLPNRLGDGDIWLLSSWGLFLGAYGLNLIVLVACLSALLWILIRNKTSSSPVPFVPFLTGALISYLIWQFNQNPC